MLSTSRRTFLKTTAGFALAGPLPAYAQTKAVEPASWRTYVQPSVPQPAEKPQRLFIKNQRTGEVFNDIYKQGHMIFDDALAEMDHLMRDWRREEVMQIDRDLIDLLAAVQNEVGFAEPITVISGYRSRSTNEMLRKKIRKVAKNSYHIRGMAVDLRVDGVPTSVLRQIAMHHKIGGVGYYPGQRFIHLDTGPIRSWRG